MLAVFVGRGSCIIYEFVVHHGGIDGCHSFHKWDFASASPETEHEHEHLQTNLELSISSKSHPEAAAAEFWVFVHPQPSKFH